MTTVTLSDVLNSKSTTIEEFGTAKHGGTYLRIRMHKVQLPTNIKKYWHCAWCGPIREVWSNTFFGISLNDNCSEDHRQVEVIYRESPFTFLKVILGLKPEVSVFYDAMSETMTTGLQIYFNDTTHYDVSSLRKADATDETRRIFAKALADNVVCHEIIDKNGYLHRDRLSKHPLVQKVMEDFSMETFYYDNIGTATSVSELPWQKITLTETFFAGLALELLPKKQRTERVFRDLCA